MDAEDKEERPFILEGKRISETDLQILLEIVVRVNMISDSKIIGGWVLSSNKIMNGANKVPMGQVAGEVCRSTRHSNLTADVTRFANMLLPSIIYKQKRTVGVKEFRTAIIRGILADRQLLFDHPRIKFFLRQRSLHVNKRTGK